MVTGLRPATPPTRSRDAPSATRASQGANWQERRARPEARPGNRFRVFRVLGAVFEEVGERGVLLDRLGSVMDRLEVGDDLAELAEVGDGCGVGLHAPEQDGHIRPRQSALDPVFCKGDASQGLDGLDDVPRLGVGIGAGQRHW